MDISLKITTPGKIIKDVSVSRVIIPAHLGDMTIIKDRAPTSVLLANGVLQILNQDGKAADKFFIKGGVADIAQDKCIIASEEVIPFNEINSAEAKEKLEYSSEKDKPFYQMIVNRLV